jgi:hypothetical protein
MTHHLLINLFNLGGMFLYGGDGGDVDAEVGEEGGVLLEAVEGGAPGGYVAGGNEQPILFVAQPAGEDA